MVIPWILFDKRLLLERHDVIAADVRNFDRAICRSFSPLLSDPT
jgi:hypothetical protein